MFVLVLLVGTSVWNGAQDSDLDTMLIQAEDAYVSGDFTTAIILYEQIVATGRVSGELYYNLGSAYYEADSLGRSLVNFYRARMFMPRDAELSRGISLVLTERIDLQGDETILLDSMAGTLGNVLTTRELALLTYSMWFVWCIMGIGVWNRYLVSTLRSFWAVMGVVVLILLILFGTRVYVEQFRSQAVVIDSSIDVYSGPGEDYLMLYSLSTAAEMRVVRHENGWGRVVLPDARVGWLDLDGVVLIR